jgi:hypothetical protein
MDRWLTANTSHRPSYRALAKDRAKELGIEESFLNLLADGVRKALAQ